MTTKNAFVLVHFGDNLKYLEYEFYFCKMLKLQSTQDIIYMYSETDTPRCFVDEISKFVTKCVGYDDKSITFDVTFTSHYTSFNTLRTCNFIFAYTLEQYDKICIVESDLIIMRNIDSIFELNTPSILYYEAGSSNLNNNELYTVSPSEIIKNCKEQSNVNGGVLIIKPDKSIFEKCKKTIPIIAKSECKYPNEALFQYVNSSFYNLPVKYNLSHFHTKKLKKYRISENDVLIFHFNETEFKPLNIIKDNWIPNMENKDKYTIKLIPIKFFNDKIYIPYKDEINRIIDNITSKINDNTCNDSTPSSDSSSSNSSSSDSSSSDSSSSNSSSSDSSSKSSKASSANSSPSKTSSKSSKSSLTESSEKQKELTFIEALTEYYSLKTEYEVRVLKTEELNKTNKRSKKKYIIMKPKCINCERTVGTIFMNEMRNDIRVLKAKCGSETEPCDLNIELSLGIYINIFEQIEEMKKDLTKIKNDIIYYKNDLIFGYRNKNNANKITEDFGTMREDINGTNLTLNSLYDRLYEVEKGKNQEMIDKLKEKTNLIIKKIKMLVSNEEYENAVKTFIYELDKPIEDLRNQIYSLCFVECVQTTESSNKVTTKYYLIQEEYQNKMFEFALEEPEVISYVRMSSSNQK
jgi:thiol-disulfide isomerase/thioredoxin